jgi:hypothetical protein
MLSWHKQVSLLGGALLLGCLGAALAQAQGWANFQNETSIRLIATPSLGASDVEEKDYAWGDVDKDGDIDLVCVRKQPFSTAGGKRNVLFMNEGPAEGHAVKGVLVDRTTEYIPGFLDATNDRDVTLVDVNGDNWLDIITATTYNGTLGKSFSHPRIYINRGNDASGKWLGYIFDDVNRIPTFSTAPTFCDVSGADVDNDGDTDLHFVDYGSLEDRLLINDGNGYFTDQTTLRMTSAMYLSGFGTSGVLIDMNGDRTIDIVRNMAGSTEVIYNNPAQVGFFNKHKFPYGGASYFVDVGDLNNDGRPDLAISDDGTDRYLLNQGNGVDGTVNFSTHSFSGDDGFGGTIHIADINNDGFNDVFIADVDVDISGCNRRAHAYRNLGNIPNVTLQEQGMLGIGAAGLQGTFDHALRDINGDGWLDIVLGRCSGTSVWIQIPPAGLIFTYPAGLPAFLPPDTAFTFKTKVAGQGTATPVFGTAKLHYSVDNQPFVAVPMTPVASDTYEATLPALPCAKRVNFYVSAQASTGGTFTDPAGAPASSYTGTAAEGTEITRDEIEGPITGWTISSHPSLTAGAWEQAVPNPTIVAGIGLAAPDQDATAGDDKIKCFVTQNGPPGGAAAASDVDGGPTYLVSPPIDLEDTDAEISYARWFFCDNLNDVMTIEVSNVPGESNWVLVDTVTSTGSKWETVSFLVSKYVLPTSHVRVRFGTSDNPNNSVTEAGVDNFQVTKILCATGGTCPGDTDGDGSTCQNDLGTVLASYGLCAGDPGFDPAADVDQGGPSAGCVDQSDLGILLGNYGCGSCE